MRVLTKTTASKGTETPTSLGGNVIQSVNVYQVSRLAKIAFPLDVGLAHFARDAYSIYYNSFYK